MLFAGKRAFFADTETPHLNAWKHNGGIVTELPSVQVDLFFASSRGDAKDVLERFGSDLLIFSPAWITDSVQSGRWLPLTRYLLPSIAPPSLLD
jgi:hypothetical protein